MKYCLIVFVAFFLASCAHQSRSTKFPIIDAHAHFNSKKTQKFDQPSPEMLAEYEEAGIVGAVIHFSEAENFQVKTNRKSPVRLATCMGLHPGDSVKNVERGIREGRFQCMKVYLGYVPLWASDKFYHPFYRLAETYQIPVVFHTGDTFDKKAKVKYADPLQIDEIAVEYPKVKFVIAHMGNPWFQSAAEVVYKNDNVYVDVSALVLGDVSNLKKEEVEELVIKPLKWFYAYVENPKKFLFGSDWPLMKVKPYIELLRKVIPESDWRNFFYENAQEVFKLSKAE